MIKIDLVTGFLGAGKTTFLKKYAAWCMAQGESVCILENDMGAVNVDLMLLSELMEAGCDMETVAGGCDPDTHRRRFRTKLISMAMYGYNRVIVEPSGIFDMDEFFDTLRDEPLDRMYEIGSIIAITEPEIPADLPEISGFVLASEVSCAGILLPSRIEAGTISDKDVGVTQPGISATISDNIAASLNAYLQEIKCSRRISSSQILVKNWDELTDEDMERIRDASYYISDYEKHSEAFEHAYDARYFFNVHMTPDELRSWIEETFADPANSGISRIKGFIPDGDSWWEVNATRDNISITPAERGQEIIIVIGEK